MGAQDISWWNLAAAYLLLIIPYCVMRRYKMSLTKDMFVSIGRMTVQLFLVGLYLEFIFKLNSPLLNVAWLVTMFLITVITVLQRTSQNRRLYFTSIFGAVCLSILATDLFLLWGILRLDNLFEASYLIPISGMLIGNSLSDLVVSINLFFSSVEKQENTYRFALANGATRNEALSPFMRDAIRISLNRGLANTAVMGLVSLPGMMTGQILGGSSPQVAIKYQILIMITIFVSSTVSIFLSLFMMSRKAFDEWHNRRR